MKQYFILTKLSFFLFLNIKKRFQENKTINSVHKICHTFEIHLVRSIPSRVKVKLQMYEVIQLCFTLQATICNLLYYNVKLCAPVVFVSALCVDVHLAAFAGQSCKYSSARPCDPGQLKCPGASHTRGIILQGTNRVVVCAIFLSKQLQNPAYGTPWQTETIGYRSRLTGRLEWPGGLWKFWSSSIPHPRGRALAL